MNESINNIIKYTIIIPHKNIPNLLQRCLASILPREDMQIIVVDDCSDEKYKISLKNISEKYTYVDFVYLNKSNGGGKARNEGLKLAKGYYILFADADDFFNYCINNILEEYKDTTYDIVYFNANSLDTDTYVSSYRSNHLNQIIDLYKINPQKAIFKLKYLFGEPWCKMVKHDIIKNNNITFSETIIHNDTKYSYLVGHFSTNVHVDNRAIYCVTNRTGSVSKNISLERLYTRTYIFAEATVFFNKNGINIYGPFVFDPLYYFLSKRDINNCKKCWNIMNSCGMSNKLIIKGFIPVLLKETIQLPRKAYRKLCKILQQ